MFRCFNRSRLPCLAAAALNSVADAVAKSRLPSHRAFKTSDSASRQRRVTVIVALTNGAAIGESFSAAKPVWDRQNIVRLSASIHTGLLFLGAAIGIRALDLRSNSADRSIVGQLLPFFARLQEFIEPSGCRFAGQESSAATCSRRLPGLRL